MCIKIEFFLKYVIYIKMEWMMLPFKMCFVLNKLICVMSDDVTICHSQKAMTWLIQNAIQKQPIWLTLESNSMIQMKNLSQGLHQGRCKTPSFTIHCKFLVFGMPITVWMTSSSSSLLLLLALTRANSVSVIRQP